ncbi:hypothetical protein [Nocardiopsis sp. NPDC057823]|uniref:hypothetical protein n=1 Tax=Nocardiopsis sp. NPDC057823 TaxID=3346256 RepID=UPI003670551F
MEMLILAALAAMWCKNVALDFGALATGKTPPSHAYRMAKLREKAARERRRQLSDPDMRGGLKMVARHCWLDACEDLDTWRANRRATKPERKAARQARRQAREGFTARWGWRPSDPMPEDVIDAEIVDETTRFTPDAPPPGAAGGSGVPGAARRTARTTTTTTTTSSTVTEESTAPGSDVVLLTPDEETVRPPLPHRRMVLMTMLASAGFAPDVEAIGRMGEEEVDGAITALIAHERATRGAAHTP